MTLIKQQKFISEKEQFLKGSAKLVYFIGIFLVYFKSLSPQIPDTMNSGNPHVPFVWVNINEDLQKETDI